MTRAASLPAFKAKKTPILKGSVHIHRDIFDQLRRFATRHRVTMSSAVEVAVTEMVRRYEKGRKRPTTRTCRRSRPRCWS